MFNKKKKKKSYTPEFKQQIVEISGADFDEDTDLWKLVSAKAGFAYEGQFASEKQIPSSSKMPYAGDLKPL